MAFLFSAGQHLFMPLNTSIAMELAEEGKTGRRLGQLNSLRSTAAIFGSFFIFLGFKYFHFNFKLSFLIAASFYLLAALFLFSMHPGNAHPPAVHLKFHKEYRLYYWLSILFGTRKQIFLTFAPWVLVTVFKQPTAILATLLTIAGISGILFQPILGRAIDSWGEKTVLALEAFFLIFVCMGYGFSKDVFSPQTAFLIACVCFVADQLLMSVNMARATYLKKIARAPVPHHPDPDHVDNAGSHFFHLDRAFGRRRLGKMGLSDGLYLRGGNRRAQSGFGDVYQSAGEDKGIRNFDRIYRIEQDRKIV